MNARIMWTSWLHVIVSLRCIQTVHCGSVSYIEALSSWEKRHDSASTVPRWYAIQFQSHIWIQTQSTITHIIVNHCAVLEPSYYPVVFWDPESNFSRAQCSNIVASNGVVLTQQFEMRNLTRECAMSMWKVRKNLSCCVFVREDYCLRFLPRVERV